MKKLMLITAVTLTSVSAFASKARWNSLQNAEHISDIQRVFQDKPEEILNYEAATVEFGSATGTTTAEGGFIRKMGDSAWSMYLGRPSTTFAASTGAAADSFAAAATVSGESLTSAFNQAFAQANSLTLGYGSKAGDISWGTNVFYVANDFKSSQTFTGGEGATAEDLTVASSEQNIAGIQVGATNGTWDAQLRQGLMGKMELNGLTSTTSAGVAAGIGNVEVESKNSTRVRGGYKMDTMYYYGSYAMGSGELTTDAGTTEVDSTDLVVGVVNSMKKDGVDFFYGASIVVSEDKTEAGTTSKTNTTRVPLLVGLEAEVNTWLTLRGAVSQSLGALSSTKTTGSSNESLPADTTSSLGAGFKMGKAMLDLTIGTGSTGTFGLDDDGDNFAQAALTYNF